MPRREGVRSESGRSKEGKKKQWPCAVDVGVMLKRFERTAPVVAWLPMKELAGNDTV